MRVDVAEVNGRVFLNNSSLGLYPRIVQEREDKERRGLGRMLAMAFAVAAVIVRLPLLKVSVDVDGKLLTRKTLFVFVGNNLYETNTLPVGQRSRLTAGTLCLFIARSAEPLGVATAALRAAIGKLRAGRHLDVFCAPQFRVHARHRQLEVAVDGEVVAMRSPLTYRILPRALEVVIPQEASKSV